MTSDSVERQGCKEEIQDMDDEKKKASEAKKDSKDSMRF